MFETIDYYVVRNTKGLYLNKKNTWTNKFHLAIQFGYKEGAAEACGSIKSRSVWVHTTVGTVIENRYETETFLNKL